MGTNGGARRDRTADLLHAMQALSQLSYSPENEARNLRELPATVKRIVQWIVLLLIVNPRLFYAPLISSPVAAARFLPRSPAG